MDYFALTLDTLHLVLISWFLSALAGIPLGIVITREKLKKILRPIILRFTGIIETIPALAMICILIPLLGITWDLMLFALFLYGLFPVIMNTYTGIDEVDASIIEAAKGMGMNDRQILTKVQLPLSIPLIITGLEISIVYIVGIAPLGFFVAVRTLGDPLFRGFQIIAPDMMVIGSILLVLMGIGLSRLIRHSKSFLKVK